MCDIMLRRLIREACFTMRVKNRLKFSLMRTVFGLFFAVMSVFALGNTAFINNAHAEPETQAVEVVEVENEDNQSEEGENTEEQKPEEQKMPATDNCQASLGALGWLVCPTTGKIAEAVDWLYDKIEQILIINPVSSEDGSPIYEIWKYCRGITNVVFIIFLLVVIYSQITGLGINNYGIKRALPKLIVAAILVNISFLICSLAVDVSNVVGNSLRGLFSSIAESAVMTNMPAETGDITIEAKVASAKMYSALAGTAALTIGGVGIAFETGAIWMLIPVVLGAIVAVVTGLITIALRQAVVALLVMISPLAMVANILPNTEQWFKKWKDLLYRMLVFYPMFSLLFGASNLAGFAIIASSNGDGFWVLLGTAVQIFPLFFSWSLMKMSGTFLGTINTRLRGLAAGPLATNRAWAESHRQQTNAWFMAHGRTPYSRLRQFLNNRQALRETDTESLKQIRKGRANLYVQRKISGGYDGTKAQGTKDYLRANGYTRNAKEAMNVGLQSETATLDTKHVLNNYGDYFVERRIRERISEANRANDEGALRNLASSNRDYRLASTSASNFLEYSRAQMTAENDSEADFNFMVNEYLNAVTNKKRGQLEKYRHYIESSAGGLGEIGQTRVLGKIIARAASVESNQRRDINIIANKFPHMKNEFRNMLTGYYVDGDGYATDRNYNRLPGEKYPGYLLQHHPEQLVLWDKVDENGPYYDWYDTNGNYVTRIYKNDSSAVKELLSNFDAPINDPINNLYGILAGMKPDGVEGSPLRYIGLDKYRTTIGRALQNAPFKEKNAMFSPMVKEMIAKGYIKNYVHENIAYLDSLNKATKTGGFNMQDGAAIRLVTTLMDPDQWDEAFRPDLARTRLNIDGELLSMKRRREDGTEYKVYADERDEDGNYIMTDKDLMDVLKQKFIFPAAHKITMMMSKQTPNTADNQKAGTVEDWKKLKETFDAKWGEGKQVEEDPYKQSGDMRSISREIQQNLYTLDDDGNRVSFGRNRNGRNNNGRTGGPSGRAPQHVNHHVAVDEMHINSNDNADDFARNFVEYCDSYPELARARRDFEDFVADRGYMVTEQELYEFAIELLDAYTNLD